MEGDDNNDSEHTDKNDVDNLDVEKNAWDLFGKICCPPSSVRNYVRVPSLKEDGELNHTYTPEEPSKVNVQNANKSETSKGSRKCCCWYRKRSGIRRRSGWPG